MGCPGNREPPGFADSIRRRAEDLFSLSIDEIKALRILIAIPLILGVGLGLFAPQRTPLPEMVLTGNQQISISIGSEAVKLQSVSEHGKISPKRVVINEATFEDLVACPGIGGKTAALILEERRFGLFFDWRDLETRVKNIGAGKIRTLQDAGVRLNRD